MKLEASEATASTNRLAVSWQYAVPQHFLSALMRRATRVRTPFLKNRLIEWFIRHYGVDMSLAEEPVATAYSDFNSFFTRKLRADARPITRGAHTLLCPADGRISEAGRVNQDQALQCKGQPFRIQQLLGDDPDWSTRFSSGSFLNIYLSPRDYHRVHMPTTGKLRRMVYVPGRLFSVNDATTRAVPGLFVRNERVAFLFETALGPLALVMVGAIFVGSIETVWAGMVTPADIRRVRVWDYLGEKSISVEQGEEVGRFNMGSTVIVLIGNERVALNPTCHAGEPVCMGQTVGRASVSPPQDPQYEARSLPP